MTQQYFAYERQKGELRPPGITNIKPAIGIFITCLLLYLLTYSGRQYSIDGIVMFQYAKAILFDASMEMVPPVQWGIEFSVSKWPVGMTLAYIPLLLFLSKTFFQTDPSIHKIPFIPGSVYNPELLENRPYLYSAILNPFFTATSGVLIFLVCIKLGLNRKQSAAIALIYGLASPAAVYAKLDYAQPMAALFLLMAFFFLLLIKIRGLAAAFGVGLSMGITILTRPELAILSPILAGAINFSINHGTGNGRLLQKRLVHIVGFGIPLVALIFLNLFINAMRFGSWFSVGYHPITEFTLNPARILTAITGNLISPGRGIFFFFPLSCFAIFGMQKMKQDESLIAWTLTAIVATTLLMYSAWVDWGAGVSWGPRFFIPIMPFLAITGFIGLDNLRHRLNRKWLAGISLLLGWIVTMQGLLFNFVDFYATLNLSTKMIDKGDYNFLPYNSPILRGWDLLSRPQQYDIFWLDERILQLNEANMFLIPFLSLIALAFAVKSWFVYFRSS